MPNFAVWTLGVDRPGIVAGVTGALFEQGCNLADCSMTILAGHFAMVLIVEADADADVASLEEALSAPAVAFDLGVSVRELVDQGHVSDGDDYVVSVYGADKPGIVHHVATVLAEANVNITDLETRCVGDPADPVYAMLLEVTLPAGVSAPDVTQRLHRMGAELGVDTSLHPADVDVF